MAVTFETLVQRGHSCRVRAQGTYVAWHSRFVVENGWEPFDQPGHAAYLPFRFQDALILAVDGGRVLVRVERSLPPGLEEAVKDAFVQADAPKRAAAVALSGAIALALDIARQNAVSKSHA